MCNSLMKILSSSPYATFNVKEWNSVITNKNLSMPLGRAIVEKHYFGKYKKFEFKAVNSSGSEKPKHIQLSFA